MDRIFLKAAVTSCSSASLLEVSRACASLGMSSGLYLAPLPGPSELENSPAEAEAEAAAAKAEAGESGAKMPPSAPCT
jgi:hypothetical protein